MIALISERFMVDTSAQLRLENKEREGAGSK